MTYELFSLLTSFRRTEPLIDELKCNRKLEEAQSARSGRFNTLPKRPKIDKFKHRSGPKAQKYR